MLICPLPPSYYYFIFKSFNNYSYEQLVTKIWPEFAAHGKGDTTIEQVMKHEGMLYKFDCALQASELAADRIKDGSVSNTIANQKPVSVDVGCAVCGVRRVYAISRLPLRSASTSLHCFILTKKNGILLMIYYEKK